MDDLTAAVWPAEKLGEAIETLLTTHSSHRNRIAPTAARPSASLQYLSPPFDESTIGQWIDVTASRYGWEAEATTAGYAALEQLLKTVSPAILQLPLLPKDNEQARSHAPHFLVLVKASPTSLTLLQPDQTTIRVPLSTIRDHLSHSLTQPHQSSLNRILERSNVASTRHDRVRQSLLTEMIGTTPITGCWHLRLSPGVPLRQQFAFSRSFWRSALLSSITALQLTVTVLAWWIIGRSALTGHFEWAWLWAWALLMLTTIPLQLAMNGVQNELVLAVSTLFKERLLFGALRLRPEAVRLEGAGHFLGRVFSAESLEQLSMAGGVMASLAFIQLLIAGLVLSLGAGGWGHVLLLASWTVLMLLLGWRVYRHADRIHKTRRSLTNDLVERMVGHRTRLAQESPEHWHRAEDADLAHYQHQVATSDRATSRFRALIPRGWMVVGMSWFFVVLLMAEHSVAEVAISLGGVLFARQAFSSIVLGTQSIIGALLAWVDVKPLFEAATQDVQSDPQAMHRDAPRFVEKNNLSGQTNGWNEAASSEADSNESQASVISMRNVSFRYPSREEAVLDKCSMKIHPGEKVLLQGPSGGGKSTLVNLMAGLEKANRGTLLLHGTDHETMNEEAWRQRVVAVPQFHQNHVLTGTLAFNLLMGKSWPASPKELKRAEAVCRALGLGDLLDRMPAGLQQIVGESGWQLSHGERSRLYIARAILQEADLVILDESFGALDPESLAEALETVLEEVPTLMVVAHP